MWANYTAVRANCKLPVNAISRCAFNFLLNNARIGFRGTLVGRLLLKTQVGICNRTWQSTRGLWAPQVSWNGVRWRPFIQGTSLTETRHEAFQGLSQPGRWIRGGLVIQVL